LYNENEADKNSIPNRLSISEKIAKFELFFRQTINKK